VQTSKINETYKHVNGALVYYNNTRKLIVKCIALSYTAHTYLRNTL